MSKKPRLLLCFGFASFGFDYSLLNANKKKVTTLESQPHTVCLLALRYYHVSSFDCSSIRLAAAIIIFENHLDCKINK